jgi:hypothetical protein
MARRSQDLQSRLHWTRDRSPLSALSARKKAKDDSPHQTDELPDVQSTRTSNHSPQDDAVRRRRPQSAPWAHRHVGSKTARPQSASATQMRPDNMLTRAAVEPSIASVLSADGRRRRPSSAGTERPPGWSPQRTLWKDVERMSSHEKSLSYTQARHAADMARTPKPHHGDTASPPLRTALLRRRSDAVAGDSPAPRPDIAPNPSIVSGQHDTQHLAARAGQVHGPCVRGHGLTAEEESAKQKIFKVGHATWHPAPLPVLTAVLQPHCALPTDGIRNQLPCHHQQSRPHHVRQSHGGGATAAAKAPTAPVPAQQDISKLGC